MDEDKSADPAAYVDEYNVHQLLKVGRRVKIVLSFLVVDIDSVTV